MATNSEVLAQSTAVAQAAAQSIGGSFEQGKGFTPGTATTPTTTQGADPFTKVLQDRLLAQANISSSADTAVETQIGAAISGLKEAAGKSSQVIESKYNREIDFTREQLGQDRTNMLEGQRGFATNQAALKQLDDRTEKSLRDLEQRKQELILSGETAAASKIAELQVQQLEFKQRAEQAAFQNILGVASFGLQMSQESRLAQDSITQNRRLQDQFEFQKETVVNELRAKFPEVIIPDGTDPSEAFKIVQPQAKKDKLKAQQLENLKANLGSAQERLSSQEIAATYSNWSEKYNQYRQNGTSHTDAMNILSAVAAKSGLPFKAEAGELFKNNFVLTGPADSQSEIVAPQTARDLGVGFRGGLYTGAVGLGNAIIGTSDFIRGVATGK